MFIDIVPEFEEDDGIAYISFFMEEDLSIEESERIGALENAIISIKKELESLREFADIGEGSIEISKTEDKDWINNWKEYFHSFGSEM